MPEYPDNFEMQPADKATIELRYKKPKEGIVGSGPNEGNPWILYSVQVDNDGEWRGWFTSPDSTAYHAHKMIQKRGYGPGISLDIELTAEGKWIIRGETYDDVFDLKPATNGTLLTRLRDKFKQIETALKMVDARLKDLEEVARPRSEPVDDDDDDIPF